MTLEQGKPLAEAKGRNQLRRLLIEWFAEEGKRIYGDTIPGHQADKRLLVIKQPHRPLTAAITPWIFPAAMITRKAGPALAAGCTMVLKPASPDAVFRAGAGRTGGIAPDPRRSIQRGHRLRRRGRRRTDQHPLVRKLSFTGSTEIGRQLMEQCAKDIKKVSLELGGNAPFIVFDDADLDKAVEGALASEVPQRRADLRLAPTACTSRTGCMTVSPRSCSRRWKNCALATACRTASPPAR
ncbi:succinate-semialdehyde dehydrogenase [Klebsiella pneumoniae]|uniref:Succinate-semialdehyde dehydrogenase n=1 Tax=Klebsiella pneumoniae TaxID=573 RepID=A0A377ZJ76_KLEPN|nr:succinate-semialdehyde dehydrogenase [Klebsiella pneumoniae]